jgi:hypothetical protein
MSYIQPAPAMEDVDFAVLREDYSRYLVHDGTVLKIKIVVRKILFTSERTPEGYPANMALDTLNIAVAIVPPTLRRPPSAEPYDPKRDVGKEQQFMEQQVATQEYMTTNGYRITVRPVLTKVLKYDKYNNLGEPIYNTAIQAITNIEKIATTGST